MTQDQHDIQPTHVVYSKTNYDGKDLIMFIGEFADLADAEELKATLNRDAPPAIGEIGAGVGIATFHLHETDEDQDYALVTPRDGSTPFRWDEMVDPKEIVELADANRKAKK